MLRVHLDTDLGGDMDDLCALALLLRWPEPVEITGITVVGDTIGRRTGMVRQVLEIAGRAEIPVAAGADVSGGYYPYELTLPEEDRYWPAPVISSPNLVEDALALLKRSIDLGATVIAIGPLTNLRLLDEQHPGALAKAPYVQMGGYVYAPREGYPAWKNDYDFNVQVDATSAFRVLSCSAPLLVPLAVTVETALRHTHLTQLRGGDPLARLIARQAEAVASDLRIAERVRPGAPRLAPDIINFQHDALAVAIALGWREGVTIERLPLVHSLVDGLLETSINEDGRLFEVVTAIDGPRFDEFWLRTVTASR